MTADTTPKRPTILDLMEPKCRIGMGEFRHVGHWVFDHYECKHCGSSTPAPTGEIIMTGISQQLPAHDPRMIAWEAFKSSAEYAEAKRWTTEPGGNGALWRAFIAGFNAIQTASV